MCSLGSSCPIRGATAWDVGRSWEPTQGCFWALQPFLWLGEGCPMALVRNKQEKGGKAPWQAQAARPMVLES